MLRNMQDFYVGLYFLISIAISVVLYNKLPRYSSKLDESEKDVADLDMDESFIQTARDLQLPTVVIACSGMPIEISMIRAILFSSGIQTWVRNRHFNSIKPGPQLRDYNEIILEAFEKDIEDIEELLCSYHHSTNDAVYAWPQTIRCVAEYLLGGWVVPRFGSHLKSPIYTGETYGG